MLKGVKKNELMSKHTTYKIGGPAKYFFTAKNEKDLEDALKWAKDEKMQHFILGGGSNILVSDDGFDGLVVRIKNNELKIKNNEIICGAGVQLSELVRFSVDNGLTGLEWAAGIPGTVGGAVRGNAGAFGSDISKSIKEVKIFQIKNKESRIKNFSNKQCKFKYRESIIKKNPDMIILEVQLKLKKGKNKAEQKKIVANIINQRTGKQPRKPSAGSVFKNIFFKDISPVYQSKIPNEIVKGGKVPVGWLIEDVELKGKRIKDAKISTEHANFIINLGNAKAADIIALISMAKMKVRNEFGVQLEEEIQLVGF